MKLEVIYEMRFSDTFGISYVVFFVLVLSVGVYSQPSTQGFISIDCGFNQDYPDSNTSIPYTTDDQYIDTGINYNISLNYDTDTLRGQEFDLRSFPNGTRNCYTLKPVNKYQKYLVRATFYYGDYDGLNTASSANPLQFDLHLGVNYWQTVSLISASEVYVAEIYSISVTEFIYVCLINTGNGIPFINELELRPLSDAVYSYVNVTTVALVLDFRLNFGSLTNNDTRYPDDLYDRIWNPFNGDNNSWTIIGTNSKVSVFSGDDFMAPSAVLQTAVAPLNSSALELKWLPDAGKAYYFAVHVAEIQNITGNATRAFDVLLNGFFQLQYVPIYLFDYPLATIKPISDSVFDIVFNATANSTLPPIANAIEVYTTLEMPEIMTDDGDVAALMQIKTKYGIKRNWVGDPCAPKIYAWDGVNCTYGLNNSRVISLTLDLAGLTGYISNSFSSLILLKYLYLSSNGLNGTITASLSDLSNLLVLDLSSNSLSGMIPDSLSNLSALQILDLSNNILIGEIPTSLGNLSSLQFMDLSYNNLTGAIPDSLGYLSSLRVLNLTGNNLTGPVPASLIKRSEEGLLILRVDNVNHTNYNGTSQSSLASHKKISTPIIIIIAVGAALLLLVLILLTFFLVWCCRKKRQEAPTSSIPVGVRQPTQENIRNIVAPPSNPVKVDNHEFNYKHLANITNNFSRVIGKGQFGIVYHGYLANGSQVAVKLHAHSGSQQIKEFITKAQNLTKVHHRNLVPLVGYCADEYYVALIYEYMSQGSLDQHLRGKGGLARALGWQERLRIAVEVAEGLHYLHRGCQPPVIHKDVKTSNILLGENFEAKITDFSLSTSFLSKDETDMVTVGTPGYIDPEFHNTYQLTEKSDVYSFGVILMELITGQPVIQPGRQKMQIVAWVTSHIQNGNIDDIVDSRLQGDFDTQSIWKVLDLSVNCTKSFSSERPTMDDVLMQLKESSTLENARNNRAVSGQASTFEVDGR